MDKSITTIDQYIDACPSASTQEILKQIRKTIQDAAPGATEKISYGIPTFVFHGNLVHFGGYESHIGFYPGALGVSMFIDELGDYETSKGTIRFPVNKPIPYSLIEKITKACARARLEKRK